jgi:hypothetical protein
LQCPHLQQNTTSYDEKRKKKTNAYHGAKNSTRISFSGSTTDLTLEGVKSMTSEGGSARTRVARIREEVEARIDEIRILAGEREVKQRRRVNRLI